MPKPLEDMTAQELREEVDRLSSAIQRAIHCLEDRKRVADAHQVLMIACPRLVLRKDHKPGGKN